MRHQAEVHEREFHEQAARPDRLALWVKQYGVSRLMRTLGKNSRAFIHDWMKHDPARRRFPQVETAAIVIWLSQREPLKEDGQPLTWDDIYGDLAKACIAHYLSDASPASRADVIAAAAGNGRVAVAGAS